MPREKVSAAVTVGAILAGWEIEPAWQPKPGDKIVLEFECPQGGQFPARVEIAISGFAIFAANQVRATGRSLSSLVDLLMSKDPSAPPEKSG